MPPPPDELHVTGEVFVRNPGIEASLYAREIQENPSEILALDLHLVQQPGMWPQVMTWVQVRYDRILVPEESPHYKEIKIFHNGELIAEIEVDKIK